MAREKKKQKIRYNEYYDMQKTVDDLYARSLRNENFYKLHQIIISPENVQMALRKLSKNSGSKTSGCDGLVASDLLKLPTDEVIKKIEGMMENYQPRKVKRVYIPKPNGDKRPLGIPSIWDRLLQQCMLQVLEPICEAKFNPYSYGFRSNRSCEHAIASFDGRINISQALYVVNIDIKGFFDNVNHGNLLKQMWSMGIRDKKVIKIISIMLKTEVAGEGFPEKGTPQGGVISPLLANIVLNEFDWWLSNQWSTSPVAKQTTNYAHRLRKSKLKRFFFVRYADDVKIICYDIDTAVRIKIAAIEWLKDRLDLKVCKEKTSITDLKKQYSEYLGIMIKATARGKNKDGTTKYVLKSKLSPKAKERIHREAQKQLKELKYAPHDLKRYQIINQYNSYVIGIHNYYQHATMAATDFADIGYKIHSLMKVRYRHYISKSNGKTRNRYINERYGRSRGLILFNGFPIVPIQHVSFKTPMGYNRKINQYTEAGRELIHKKLEACNMEILHYIMRHPIEDQSFEYNDNRISLYAAQKGKCAITGATLEIGGMHCHHKKPKSAGGTDKYDNLVLITDKVHTLIHAVSQETIQKLLNELKLEEKELQCLNKYRKMVGNTKI